ncbi:MAG TPA: hypothetical protein VFH76_25710 [Kribbella sp.]|nr:hypothetical protein [Kribbella sp.]
MPSTLLPWLFPSLASIAGLLAIDVPLGAIVRYTFYFFVCVVLPGVLLMRAFWRSTGNWAEDAGLGAARSCRAGGGGLAGGDTPAAGSDRPASGIRDSRRDRTADRHDRRGRLVRT